MSTSWTPEGVAVRVVTNKQVYCGNRLGITATMSNSSGVSPVQTTVSRFADGTIVINDTGLSPGTYTCTIVVIDQSGQVEYRSTSCQVGVRNSKQQTSYNFAPVSSDNTGYSALHVHWNLQSHASKPPVYTKIVTVLVSLMMWTN